MSEQRRRSHSQARKGHLPDSTERVVMKRYEFNIKDANKWNAAHGLPPVIDQVAHWKSFCRRRRWIS